MFKMASLLPLLQDLLPMIMPSSVHIARARDIVESPADEPRGVRVVQREAIVGRTDKMCATVTVVKPQSSTTVHHHGEQDAIIYVASGSGFLLTSPDDDASAPKRHALARGDFAFVPPWTEHQAVNEAQDEDLVWVVVRSGPQPVEVALTDWGGAQAKEGQQGGPSEEKQSSL
ncbi:hypothetical protein VTK73DRAFT_9122 [Phialemonium thermophilum]|uniref:Cupin type-2 domain-containing protein n=1 Tax=Phialemonium thermophilum TaxID=223376 RepID=A0ABR3W4H0_9PEZI